MPTYHFPDVTLLITHYNRSLSLERLLAAFQRLGCSFGEVVVSDDGSKPEHQPTLHTLAEKYHYKLITTPVNKGLGNNINKGQDAVTKPYTLYVQEDFEPTEKFPEAFTHALGFMNQDPTLDIARFYAYFSYPGLTPFKNGFSTMRFSFWNQNHLKFYYYSDHPHLRRSNFLQKFGRYPEGIKGDLTEYKMAISFLQKKGKGIFYDKFTEIFLQKNSSDEPSTMERAGWRESKNQLILIARALYLRYRWLKNMIDYKFMR